MAVHAVQLKITCSTCEEVAALLVVWAVHVRPAVHMDIACGTSAQTQTQHGMLDRSPCDDSHDRQYNVRVAAPRSPLKP